MNSFDSELRELIEKWRGDISDDDMISHLEDAIERLVEDDDE